MAIRKYKPTTPGRRGSQRRRLRRDHPLDAGEVAAAPAAARPVAATTTAASRPATIGGGHKRQYRLDRLPAHDKDGVPAKVAHIEYDPNRTARIALLHYADGEKRYILAPKGLKQGDPSSRARAPTSSRATTCRCATSRSAPRCTPSSCARAAARKLARSAGVGVQLRGQGGRLRHAAHAVRRDPPRRRALPRHHRRGRQRRAVEHQRGKAGRKRWKGVAPDRPRCRHEPGRPPARWWRGQDLRWSPPGQPRGASPRAAPVRNKAAATSSSSAVATPARSASRSRRRCRAA